MKCHRMNCESIWRESPWKWNWRRVCQKWKNRERERYKKKEIDSQKEREKQKWQIGITQNPLAIRDKFIIQCLDNLAVHSPQNSNPNKFIFFRFQIHWMCSCQFALKAPICTSPTINDPFASHPICTGNDRKESGWEGVMAW